MASTQYQCYGTSSEVLLAAELKLELERGGEGRTAPVTYLTEVPSPPNTIVGVIEKTF